MKPKLTFLFAFLFILFGGLFVGAGGIV